MAEKKKAVKKEEKKEKPVRKEKPLKPAKPAKPARTLKKELEKPTDAGVAEAFNTIRFVLMTEKSVRVVEAQNKLVFITRRDARRDEIKKAVETAFNSPVARVTTMIDSSGRKKAFVRFAQPGAAGDIAIRLGII